MTVFGILGSVQALSGNRPARLPGKQRSVLGVLLLYPNTPVSLERLIDCLWEEPPASAVSNIHSYVTRLRRTVVPHLVTQDHGYLLTLERTQLDLLVFEDTLSRARGHADAGDLDAASDAYRDALSLWRGRPAEDALLTSSVAPRVALLEELALSARSDWTDVRLRLGLHEELIGELRALAEAHSLNEGVWRQLILALHRSGRRAEALEMFGQVRTLLASELGVEPGTELQRLRAAILGDDAVLARPERETVRLVPRQLPPAVGRLIGRRAELKHLDELSAARVILVVGGAGVGKTTLAVHWAHRVAERFPDGQLFLDLRGFDQAQPMSTAEALPRLIQGLGRPAEDIPVELEVQIGLYRSILAGQRVLVVLDNAAEPDQIRSLIPPETGSRILVTSRDRLSGLVALESAGRITLDVLDPDAAVDLLADTMGPDRIRGEPHAAARLAELCARLPLALRVAGARAASGPHRTLAQYVAELGDHDLLSHLEVEGDRRTAVRGAVGRSYEALAPAARRLFRLAGLVPNTGITVAGAVALAGHPPGDTAGLLEDLARVHLMTAEPDRYTCHDLLVAYAAERTEAEDSPAERETAVDRYLDFYLRTIVAAGEHVDVRVVGPAPDGPVTEVTPLSFGTAADASSWLDQEWDTIAAMIARAAERGPHPMAWRLADALRDVMSWKRPIAECLRVAELGLKAARAEQDGLGQGAMLMSIGYVRWRTADLDAAIDAYRQALPFLRRAGWRAGESAVLRASGVALAQAGTPEQAVNRFRRALAIDRELGNRAGETSSLGNLAALYLDLGRLRDAEERHRQALDAAVEIGKRRLEAVVRTNLGVVQREMGRLGDAFDTLSGSLSLGREIGSPYVEAMALESLGGVHLDAGRHESALQALSEAISVARSVENHDTEVRALIGLARAKIRSGAAGDADDHLAAAAAVTEHTGHRPNQVDLLLARSELASSRGLHAEALAHADGARRLAGDGFPLALGKTHSAVAAAYLGLGDPAACQEHCEEALRIFRRTGQRLAQARALITLGHALQSTGNEGAARSARRRAHAIATKADASL
ncbi:DNA-binding transcriptional activator of the SARP family [Nonomuraea solani]|uniref:DNA-binding transcriptional activator of the SARP family n=1 Tax=Nonomuraea solani TaxID=1144553 RepID=A0A1H6DWM2_9ACTN|nr:tetratricopeptide repeat protein [Nonomuraea solani]SEG88985.1 DNA-binding transcriptional activator of the SARP family [Nonomuraea solani]